MQTFNGFKKGSRLRWDPLNMPGFLILDAAPDYSYIFMLETDIFISIFHNDSFPKRIKFPRRAKKTNHTGLDMNSRYCQVHPRSIQIFTSTLLTFQLFRVRPLSTIPSQTKTHSNFHFYFDDFQLSSLQFRRDYNSKVPFVRNLLSHRLFIILLARQLCVFVAKTSDAVLYLYL